jgi:Antibiotic biosynthesis monooxygenase
MTQPIAFLTRSKIKEGRRQEFDTFFRERVPVITFGDPGTVALLSYLSEDGRELHIVHVFLNADAFDAHLTGVEERETLSGDYLQGLAWEIYGAPNAETLEGVQARAAKSGVRVTIYPDNFGGYLRAGAE